MFEQIAQMVRDGGKPPYVHFICDVRQRGSIAPDILSLGQLRQLIGDNSLVGWTIVVDSQPHLIMKSLAHILSQLLKARLRVFTTMQEAVSFLVDMDKTLPVLEVEQIERRLT
ncbi:MAG: hypothetical protein NZ750_13315 [Anaerolineae bacterium]|nr:hypothetical protein [Anaerolineae bacterium]MDW8172779.1 hypothetical protein [Anaerolineae bacterium]